MISAHVPATSANLGPGFDALGLAVSLTLEVQAKLSKTDNFLYRGEGALPDSADNLVHKGFSAAYAEVGERAPKVTFTVDNPIPLARGLGSSSAALVAGIATADVFLGGALGRDGVFQLAARLEGHPDNVGPAVYGGFTVAARRENGTYLCESLQVPETWQLLFAVPDFELPTSEARAVLPETYARADLVFNAGRTALWSLAVAQNKPELLRVASQDRVHEPYREGLVPGLASCRTSLFEVGAHAAFLSGAGPTVGVVCGLETKAVCQKVLRAFVGDSGKILSLAAGEGYAVTATRQFHCT